MQILNLEQKSNEWLNARLGKVTGTGLKKIVGTKTTRDEYFYELLAQRLSCEPHDDENAMERGDRLEEEARQEFERVYKKKVERIGFILSDENQNIACSPDGLIKNKGVYNEALEIKCLSSKNYLKAVIENQIPKDYYAQVVNYFIVNDDLKKLYFFLYDPRVQIKPYHTIEVLKEEIKDDIINYKQQALETLNRVESTIQELIQF